MNIVGNLLHALGYIPHEAGRGIHALNQLSARENNTMGGEYLAEHLRNAGIPQASADPWAQGVAQQDHIGDGGMTPQQYAIYTMLLKRELMHHR